MASRGAGSSVGDAVAKKIERRKFFDAANACGSEDGGLAGRKRNGDFDCCVFFVTFAAAKTETTFGNVVALDDFFVEMVYTHASGEVNAGANVAAAIGLAATGKRRERRW